ncbi:hypothetical protein ACTXT7_007237 [Hymenolepis weldensis]
MCDEVLPFGDIPRSNGQRSCYDSLISDKSYNEDYIYQLEYEKRKHIEQIENLQQQLDLSDRRNSELSEEITVANNLNHRNECLIYLLLQEKKSLQFKILVMEEKSIAKSHSDDTGYLTNEPVSPIQISNFGMNKCEFKSIGEEIENALSEISVYEESGETEISGTKEKEVFQTEDESSILLTEGDITMRRVHIKKYIPERLVSSLFGFKITKFHEMPPI